MSTSVADSESYPGQALSIFQLLYAAGRVLEGTGFETALNKDQVRENKGITLEYSPNN